MDKDKIKEIAGHLEEFNTNNVPDIFQNTRERYVVEHRQLFHTILRNKYKYTFQAIADFMISNGRPTKHELVMHSVKRTLETNYYNSDSVAKIYDQYFEDKREERVAKMSTKYNYSSKLSKLQDLLKDIPTQKENEIYELVLLRMKSWSWKSNDNCKVVEGI